MALVVALVAAGCGGDGGNVATTPKATTSSPFAYDASRPLAVRDAGRR